MKRYFSFLLPALLAAATACAQQQDYLTFRTASGAERSLPAVGLKMTFADGRLTAVSSAGQVVFALTELSSMYFSSTPTGIAAAGLPDAATVTVENGRLRVNAPAGTPVRVFGADGREVRSDALGRGLYIVRVGDKNYKVMAQ